MERYTCDTPLTAEALEILAQTEFKGTAVRLLLATDDEAALTALCDNLENNETVTELCIATTQPLPTQPFVKLFQKNLRIQELGVWSHNKKSFFEVGPILASSTGLLSLYMEQEPSADFVEGLKSNKTLREIEWVKPAANSLFELWRLMKKNQTNITDLILKLANLTTIALVDLDKALARTKTLQYLELDTCRFEAREMNTILGHLEHNTSLKKLVITDAVLPLNLDSRFTSGLANHVLTNLEISNCTLTLGSCQEIEQLLGSKKCVIRTLNLSYNAMDAKMINAICRGLRRNSTVFLLNLYNSLRVDAFSALHFENMVRENKTLTHLMIGGHNTLLNVEYIDFLSKLQHSRITHLDIDNASLNAQQVVQVALMVRHSPWLIDLNISGSIDENEAARDILDAAFMSKSLSTLNLADSNFDDEVADSLRGLLLSDSCPLAALNLGNNDLGDATLDKIATAVALNDHLQCFVFGLSATEEGISRFMETIDENQTLITLDLPNAGGVQDLINAFCDRNSVPFLRKRQASCPSPSSSSAKSPRNE